MRASLILFISLLFISSKDLYSQKIALLDTKFKKPILYTDSVTANQVSAGLIPVLVKDFDTLYSNLKYLEEVLNVRQRAKMQSFELKTSMTLITVSRIPKAYGDRYLINMQSKSGEIISSCTLSDADETNKKTAQKISDFLNYIKTNNSFFGPPKEIQPKIYNVIIITDR
jgi:hypothetical protein